jgi:enterochelin esterase-like enzyme
MHSPRKALFVISIRFAVLLLLFPGLTGCERDPQPPAEPEPFVRLLKNQSFRSSILHRDINYAVLLPADYDSSVASSYPVVYLLHGYGDNESAWYQYGLISYYADADPAGIQPMIYVMPQGFNTYWVNKYNGQYPYMDVMVKELVPTIDSLFRTVKDAQHRAVMGYSMGGYGALILPARNPGVFRTGVVLSMSFRTDEQYMAEPQSNWDSQWGTLFGGIGSSGTARLTDYFISHSPFHFFKNPADPSLQGQRYFIDCGDDEETLSETSDLLHAVMRGEGIRHEYRVRNGAHDWSYWHRSLPEALRFISKSVSSESSPDEAPTVDPGPEPGADRVFEATASVSGQNYRVMVPAGYSSDTSHFPLIVSLHECSPSGAESETRNLFAMFSNLMSKGNIPASLVVEIPVQGQTLTENAVREIIDEVRTAYRIRNGRAFNILAGNAAGGGAAFEIAPACADLFNACLLFDAVLPSDAAAGQADLSYYLDITDQAVNYAAYHGLYMSLRQNSISHEYRVRQGLHSPSDFLNGLYEASGYISKHLK